MPESCFEGAHLSAIVLPDAVTAVGERAFYDNSASKLVTLSELSAPDVFFDPYNEDADWELQEAENRLSAGLASIGASAFEGNALDAVTLPSLQTAVGSQGFDETTRVTSDEETCEWVYTIHGPQITVIGWNGTAAELTVPDDINALHVTAFGNRVFYRKTFLKSAVLPDDTASMGTELFRDCTELVTADLGERSSLLPVQTFFGCRKLTGGPDRHRQLCLRQLRGVCRGDGARRRDRHRRERLPGLRQYDRGRAALHADEHRRERL